MNVYLDFETRSRLDVQAVGASRYSRDPSTSIICLAFDCSEWDEGHEPTLIPEQDLKSGVLYGSSNGVNLLKHYARDESILFHAHNAAFEIAIWSEIMAKRYAFPEIPLHRWRCTAAKAASMSLPRKLDALAEALKLPSKKDKEGHRAMLQISKPKKDGSFYTFEDDPVKFNRVYSYCIQDCKVERAVDERLPDLSSREQAVWFLDQQINQRGVQVDVASTNRILDFIEQTQTDLAEEFVQLTGGAVRTAGQVAKLREWLLAQGTYLPDLKKSSVVRAINTTTDPITRRVLEIRRDLARTSLKKYEAMLKRVDTDNRLRGNFLYYAGITGRWGGRGVQLQNLFRSIVDSDVAIDFINTSTYDLFQSCYLQNLIDVYASCIRGMLFPKEGHVFYVADFASIEARVVAWLAGQDDVLDVFRRNEDIYCVEASTIFGTVVTKKDKFERSVGKVAILALGFNGGINAFGTMARTYNVDLVPAYDILWPCALETEKEKARISYERYVKTQITEDNPEPLSRESGLVADIIKQRWRVKNSQIVAYWKEVENAAIQAVLTGEEQTVGGDGRPVVRFGTMSMSTDDLEDMYLLIKLPSGNCLKYPYVRVSTKTNSWGRETYTLSYKVEDENTYQFGRKFTYGGRLVENITQAVARDLLAAAMVRLDSAGFQIVLHVHDEIVAEQPLSDARMHEFESLMAVTPTWATGLPVAVETWQGHRYKKG